MQVIKTKRDPRIASSRRAPNGEEKEEEEGAGTVAEAFEDAALVAGTCFDKKYEEGTEGMISKAT